MIGNGEGKGLMEIYGHLIIGINATKGIINVLYCVLFISEKPKHILQAKFNVS